MTVRLRVKVGSAELEFEGSEDFLKSELSTIISHIAELRIVASEGTSVSQLLGDTSNGTKPSSTSNTSHAQLSVNSIATKMNVKLGADLVLAAAVYLTFVKQQDKFRRN